jgi:hypothetical protein
VTEPRLHTALRECKIQVLHPSKEGVFPSWLVVWWSCRCRRDRAAAILARLLRQGYDATNQVADLLQEARRSGIISDRDYQEARAADLLWGGQIRPGRQSIVLVLEASWTVGHVDVERAARRAAVLRQTGLKALPVTAGQEWPPNMQDDARRSGVVVVQDGTVDQESWDAGLAQA